jgi:hypothetical protein
MALPPDTPRRPDPRPMRLAYGAGAVAALSVMSIGLIQPASSDSRQSDVTSTADQTTAQAPSVEVRHVINYIHLKPGQTAPPGAKVITPDAPAPKIVVSHVAAPVPAPAPPPKVVVKTRQSGHP